MDNLENWRVLVSDSTNKDAAAHLQFLHDNGLNLRPELVTDQAALLQLLQRQQWDMCLSYNECPQLKPQQILETILYQEKDIPVIVLYHPNIPPPTLALRQQGAVAVLPTRDKQLLKVEVSTALKNLVLRRQVKQLEWALRANDTLCQRLLASSKEAVAFVQQNHFMYGNPAWLNLFGYRNLDALLGAHPLDLIASADKHRFKQLWHKQQQEMTGTPVLACQAQRTDGSLLAAEFRFSGAYFDQQHCVQLTVSRKQGDRDNTLESLHQQDLLTGLFNRQYFLVALEDLLAQMVNTPMNGAVLYIELEDFDSLKDTLGLAASDLVLSDAAQCLQSYLRTVDALLARYHDAAFTVLFANTTLAEAEAHGQQVVQAFKTHQSQIGQQTFVLQAFVGITAVTETSPNGQEVLSRAHRACQEARYDNHQVAVYSQLATQHRDLINKNIIAHIQQALVKGDFQLKYQPILSLHGDNQELFEVLVRMLDEEGTYLRPDKFLPAAIHAGLLNQIDRWIIMYATKKLAEHRLRGHNSYLFVMLSAPSLLDSSLLPWIQAALQDARLPNDALIFEIRETDAATHFAAVQAFAEGLKGLHCQLALTHFGSGLNSYHLLQHLPVDYVKLDGGFTQDWYQNEEQAKEKLHTLIKSVHAQGRLAIVPLVEEARVISTLWNSGANYLQGYFLSPPLDNMDYNFASHLEELS